MSTRLGSQLPEELLQRLSGQQLERWRGRVIVACSTDAGGRPHPCLLSYTEVVAAAPRDLRIAPYTGTSLVRNVARDGRLTLILVDEELAYYVKGHGRVARQAMACDPALALLQVNVAEVLEDRPVEDGESGSRLLCGIRFSQPDMEARLARARAVIAEMLAYSG